MENNNKLTLEELRNLCKQSADGKVECAKESEPDLSELGSVEASISIVKHSSGIFHQEIKGSVADTAVMLRSLIKSLLAQSNPATKLVLSLAIMEAVRPE